MHLNDAIAREPRLGWTRATTTSRPAPWRPNATRASTGAPSACVNVTAGPGGHERDQRRFRRVTPIRCRCSSSPARPSARLRDGLLRSCPELRQLGDQEVDIVHCVQKMTKYAKIILDPNSIRYELEKAIHLATTGRPGPVWLDIPIDVQSAQIDPDALPAFTPDPATPVYLPANVAPHRPRHPCSYSAAQSGASRAARWRGRAHRRRARSPRRSRRAAQNPRRHRVDARPAIATDNPYYCGRQGSHRHPRGEFHGAETPTWC